MKKDIPVLIVRGETLAKAYEKALISLWENGIKIASQYDGDNLPTIDATMNITIENPMKDPMIHKAFPGGIDSLKEYVMELKGCKDHWVKNMNDPDDTRWEYTYSRRFRDWGTWFELATGDAGSIRLKKSAVPFSMRQPGAEGINQINIVIDKLVKQPFSRQAQMITWMPFMDNDIFDPPCLQSLWYRLSETDDYYYLNCNVRFRSNDSWGAYFMNSFGMTMFNREVIADKLQERLDKKVLLGRMNWQADSFHIYGKDHKEFEKRLYNNRDKPFEKRTYDISNPDTKDIYDEAEQMVTDKIKKYDDSHKA